MKRPADPRLERLHAQREQTDLLGRIADALERISPPPGEEVVLSEPARPAKKTTKAKPAPKKG